MFVKLTEKSYIKQKPGEESLYVLYKDRVCSALVVNNSACDILKFCDGTHTTKEISRILKKKYDDDINVVENNVQEFLAPFISENLITQNAYAEKVPLKIIKGSEKVYYPDTIIWEITSFCPLRCRHCYLQKKNNYIVSKKDIDNILQMIDEIGVYQVQITGGEPLSHPNFNYIIEQLIDRKLIVSVSTSGMIFNSSIFNALLRLKEVSGSFIRCSLDGSRETHNYIRKNDFSYDKAIGFIKKMHSAGIDCQVGTTVINQTEEELEKLIVKVKNLGVSLIEIGEVFVQGSAEKNGLNSTFGTQKLCDFLKELNVKYADKNFNIKVPLKKAIKKNCGAGYQLVCIKANMDVTLCPSVKFSLGNLHKQSMWEIMKKSNSVFHNFSPPCEQFCKGCENELTCKGCTARGLTLKNKKLGCKWFETQKKFFKLFI